MGAGDGGSGGSLEGVTSAAAAADRAAEGVVVAVVVVAVVAGEHARHAMFNLKLPMKKRLEALESALNAKRQDKGIVDVIKAEDMGKFPDTNLAESLQRIPGVVIDRDAGEGRTITVRGLGGQFVAGRRRPATGGCPTGSTSRTARDR